MAGSAILPVLFKFAGSNVDSAAKGPIYTISGELPWDFLVISAKEMGRRFAKLKINFPLYFLADGAHSICEIPVEAAVATSVRSRARVFPGLFVATIAE